MDNPPISTKMLARPANKCEVQTPIRIKNSPTNPFNPGNPNAASMTSMKTP